MASLISTRQGPPIDVRGSNVVCAAAVPSEQTLIVATDANELIYGQHCRATLDSTLGAARALAVVRYASFEPNTLPEECSYVLVLVENSGLLLFALPNLTRIDGDLADQLLDLTKSANAFAVDTLGSDLVNESFRIVVAAADTVSLLDVNPTQGKVSVLGEHTLSERVASIAFSEMTIVASTAKVHHMLRVSRGGGLAVAATVNRTEAQGRIGANVAKTGDTSFVSMIGGLWRWRAAPTGPSRLALALPDNRWLLVVDQELVTYSSFGSKMDEMENVFKSKTGMGLVEGGPLSRRASVENFNERKKKGVKTSSSSSFASFATGVSHKTFLDEATATRPEKPPRDTVFTSPLVLSVNDSNDIMAFASNGSLPGILEQVSLVQEGEKPEEGVKITASRSGRLLATAVWPSGRVLFIELAKDLEALIEEKESLKEYRLALALVPADQPDRMIALRRLLAADARKQEWHDAAIHHMETVVNLSIKREGIDQVSLVSEAVELRGPRDGSWQEDSLTATMWADFLFRLRTRILRQGSADVDVLETLCRTDANATRIKALLNVKHAIPMQAGENLIASSESSLREEDRVEALVALYTSLGEHGKALVLLENSNATNAFDGVAGYLLKSIRPNDDPRTYFLHLKWLAHRAKEEAQGGKKLQSVVLDVIKQSHDSESLLGQAFHVLVEESEELLATIVDGICVLGDEGKNEKGSGALGDEKLLPPISADVFASALLAGMAKANTLGNREVFERLRLILRSRILHHPSPSYHSYTLLHVLQSPEMKVLGLHEELAFLLGRQGRHEAAADELAAEKSLSPEEALVRLTKLLPASDKASAADSLVSAYLRVSAQGRAKRIEDAAYVLRCRAGNMEIEKVLLDGRCSDESLTLAEMRPFLHAALVTGNERLRLAEIMRALRKSEVRRLREDVLSRRRRFVMIGHERACTLCTRRIGDSAFAAYPDGAVAHLACHMSKDSR